MKSFDNRPSITIEDLQLSTETAAIAAQLTVTGALHHLRAKATNGLQTRNRTIHTRKNAPVFVEVKLETAERKQFSVLLLVDDSWEYIVRSTAGKEDASSSDTLFALAEIECRLRIDPTAAEIKPMNANSVVPLPPASQPATVTAPPAAPPVPTPPPGSRSPVIEPASARVAVPPVITTPQPKSASQPPPPSAGWTPAMPPPSAQPRPASLTPIPPKTIGTTRIFIPPPEAVPVRPIEPKQEDRSERSQGEQSKEGTDEAENARKVAALGEGGERTVEEIGGATGTFAENKEKPFGDIFSEHNPKNDAIVGPDENRQPSPN